MTLRVTQVFIDLDGVLADFEDGFKVAFRCNFKELNYRDRWELIAAHPDFFGSLQRVGKEIVNSFNNVYGAGNVHILSSCPDNGFERYCRQKRDWVKKNVPELGGLVLFSRGGTRKSMFLQNKGDILVDDTRENLAAWDANGGNAVYFSCDGLLVDEADL